jgi:hypothetical protein
MTAPRKEEAIILTVDGIMALEPCDDWPRERVEAYFGNRWSIPVGEILRDEGLEAGDRMWLGTELLPIIARGEEIVRIEKRGLNAPENTDVS